MNDSPRSRWSVRLPFLVRPTRAGRTSLEGGPSSQRPAEGAAVNSDLHYSLVMIMRVQECMLYECVR